jgi:hypothetical protein
MIFLLKIYLIGDFDDRVDFRRVALCFFVVKVFGKSGHRLS